MKKLVFCIGILIFCLFSVFARADGSSVTPYISQAIPEAGLSNILNAEQVFCYTVKMPEEGYRGYTLDQMAVTGFCGVLQKQEQSILVDEFFKNNSSILTTNAKCVISPRILLRFWKGVDMTDVLISYPCPALSVFYGGTLKSFNASPIAKDLDGLSQLYEKGRVDFVSPALLNQLMPIGMAQTEEQKTLILEQEKAKPIRNWLKEEPENTASNALPDKPSTGWNKIQINKK